MGIGMLAFAAAGAAKGLGDGMQLQGKLDREQAMKRLELDAAADRTGQEIAGRHADVATEQGGATTRNTATIQAENDRNTATNTAAMDRTQAEIKAGKPLKDAEAGYYSDVKGGQVFTDDDGTLFQVKGGVKTPILDENGQKTKGTKAGAGGNKEGVVGAIADDLQKSDPTMSRGDAIEQARSGKGPSVLLAKERLAQTAWKSETGKGSGTPDRLDYWRTQYGANAAPKPASAGAAATPAPPPAVTPAPAASDADLGAPAAASPAAKAPPIPANPDDRKENTTYWSDKLNAPVTWTGKGWLRAGAP